MPEAVESVVRTMQDRLDALPRTRRTCVSSWAPTSARRWRSATAVDAGVLRGPGLGGALGRRLRRALPGRARRAPRRATGRRVRGGWPSTHRPTSRRCGTSCSASTRTSTTTCPRRCSRSSPTTTSPIPVLDRRRRRDHERIDGVLSGRVAAEDAELAVHGRTPRSTGCSAAQPAGARKRFLRESRMKVWHNTVELQTARLAGPEAYAARLASWRCSAPRGSPTCSHPARSCCGWPSPASG